MNRDRIPKKILGEPSEKQDMLCRQYLSKISLVLFLSDKPEAARRTVESGELD